MLEFRIPEINDRERACAALRSSGFQGAEYTFANNLAWYRLADSKIAFFRDFYIVCSFTAYNGSPAFLFPAGKGDIRELFAEMRSFAEARGYPLRVYGAAKDSLDMLHGLFPGEFTAEPDRDNSDYIYRVSDLAQLPGRKYHGKRNHLARFRELEYEYAPITDKNADECIVFLTQTYNGLDDKSDRGILAEQFAIDTFFRYFGVLGLKGGVISCGGKTAAVTIGEPLNSDTFCVHIEKADTSYNGIYAGINSYFVQSEMTGFEYVNREEDMGIEGLRKAKLSYHPAYLLEKYIITFR
ncbi:MAG: DUF2156 domain-containing protein [Ruminococcus sp.]|nr:DUF2156 domain-containing protein [Ruminococcus sp.]